MTQIPPEAEAMISDLAKHATNAAHEAVSRVAILAPAPYMPSIILNAAISLMALAARTTIALHKRDISEFGSLQTPEMRTMMSAIGEGLMAYPDVKVLTDKIAAAANSLGDGSVTAHSVAARTQ